MANLILCCGLSGSGKTVFCKRFVERHPDYIHLNVDDFYRTYNGEQVHENEFEVWISFFNAIHSAALRGKNVIVDTNALDAFDRIQFIRWFGEFEHHYLYWVYTDCWIAKRNNETRGRVIPEDEWWEMYHKAEVPDEVADQDWDAIRYIYNNNGEKYLITKDYDFSIGADERRREFFAGTDKQILKSIY